MKEKITSREVNGCKLNVIENKGINFLDISISYEIPTNIERRFVGVPHLFEHMIFNDIISSAKSSTEVISLASSVNVDVNAYTSLNKIVFTATLKSFILLDRHDSAFESLKRFDMTEEGMKFLKKYIEGIVADHAFTQTELDAERGIILGERMSGNSAIELIQDKLTIAVSGVDILGSEQDIREFDLDTLHEFVSILPKPSITVKYNPDIDEFSNIEYFCERALNKVKSSKVIPTNQIDRLEPVVPSIYNGALDIRHYNEGDNLNGICITYPRWKDFSIDNIERDIVDSIVMRMLMDPFLEGSIANILREKKNLTYGVCNTGLIAGDAKVGTWAYVAHINDTYNFESKASLKEFCNMLDFALTDIRIPSETEFITALSESAVAFANAITTNSTGIQCSTAASMLNDGYSPRAIEVLRTLPFEFNYRLFKMRFKDMIEFLTYVIL